MMQSRLAVLIGVSSLALAQDPSSGWLTYARFKAQPTDIITSLSATMVVPPTPIRHGGSPAFWFGVQTANGDGALVQPIMSKWLGNGFYMFQEIFDWTDERDEQSTHIRVNPGDVLDASVTYVNSSNSYSMNMTNRNTSQVSNFHYNLLPRQTQTNSVGYFVLEHQVRQCDELPPNGKVSWTNVKVEVNNQLVTNPVWVPKLGHPVCDARTVVNDPTSIDITWDMN